MSKNSPNALEVEKIILRIKKIFNVEQDKDLQTILGLSRGQAANWRSRGSLPLEQALKIRRLKGVSLDWIYFGEGAAQYNTASNDTEKQQGRIAEGKQMRQGSQKATESSVSAAFQNLTPDQQKMLKPLIDEFTRHNALKDKIASMLHSD